jgi:hypothetical protein
MDKKIIIVGDEEGNEEFCSKYSSMGFIYEPEVKRNKHNTPLIPSIFEQGAKHADEDDVIIYINSDIILCDSFRKSMENCAEFLSKNKKYLLIGQRVDVDDFPLIDFEDEDWEKKVVEIAGKRGKLHAACGIDYFIFSKNTYDISKIHPFAIGKCHWDRWLVGKCLTTGIPTVDMTKDVLAVHQNGSYFMDNKKIKSLTYTAEVRANHIEVHLGRDVSDSNYRLVDGKVSKK